MKKQTPFIIWFAWVLAILGFLAVLVVSKGFLLLLCILLIAGILLLSFYLEYGLYILVFLAPMMHWTFRLESFRFFLQDYFPQFLGFFAPMVDVWAVALLIAFGVNCVYRWLNGERQTIYLPGLFVYALFLFSAFLSISNVYPWEVVSSLKYIIRFPLFVYIGYLVLGTNLINQKYILKNALLFFLGSALLGALMGFVSLILGVYTQGGLHRAVPFAIGSWMPFGDQHIFLAEVITVALPIVMYFWYSEKDISKKFLYACIGIFMFLISLATFSRAGWLTMVMQVCVFGFLMRKSIDWLSIIRRWIWLLIVSIPFVWYMFIFLGSKIVASSNEARIALADIAWHLFKTHPIIGQGVGTFVDRVSDIYLFVYEFGTPIDAHSIVSKLTAEQGLFGLFTFSLFIVWILYRIYHRMRDARHTEQARLIAFLSFFLQYYSAKMWVPIMLAIAQGVLYKQEKEKMSAYIYFEPERNKIKTDV
ncbi:MAG: O-antigen ligase family protein [Candidatus Magasanikbacteria bacterium]|nr:O-antigen ligase family protein [Candidatus Magasanikbacteria bacterium]